MIFTKLPIQDAVILVMEPKTEDIETAVETNTHRVTVNVRSQRPMNIICSPSPGFVGKTRVEFRLASKANPFEWYSGLNILNDKDKVLTLNLVGKKSAINGLSADVDKHLIQKDGLYRFKILLRATSYRPAYTPGYQCTLPSDFTIFQAILTTKEENTPSQEEATSAQENMVPCAPNSAATNVVVTQPKAEVEKQRQEQQIKLAQPLLIYDAQAAVSAQQPKSSCLASSSAADKDVPSKEKAALSTISDNRLSSSLPAPVVTLDRPDIASLPNAQEAQSCEEQHYEQQPRLPHVGATPFSISSQSKFVDLNIQPLSFEAASASSDDAERTPSSFTSSNMVSDNASAKDCAYDVHFYHYDPVSNINNWHGAHHAILQAYPILMRLVEQTESAKRKIAAQMRLRMNYNRPGSYISGSSPSSAAVSVSAPITVDISYLPFPAFKALIKYVYTRDIEATLRTLHATSSSPLPVEPYACATGSGKQKVEEGLVTDSQSTLCLDELLFLASRFEIRELCDVCARLIHLTLTIDNAIPILVTFGEEFEVIKRHVMQFIKDNFREIFGRDKEEDPFGKVREHGDCHEWMAEILRMMARSDDALRSSTSASASTPFMTSASAHSSPKSVYHDFEML